MRNMLLTGVAILGLGAVAVIGVNVVAGLTSVATAPGRVVSKTMRTDNIVANYEYFHAANGRYLARLGQIRDNAAALESETNPLEKARIRVDLSGMRQSCRDIATDYNARSQMINRSIFKGTSTPVELDVASCG